MWKVVECFAYLAEGLLLPSQLQTKNHHIFLNYENPVEHRAPVEGNHGLGIVLGHGLGSRDPRTKSYASDDMIKILNKGTRESQNLESTILYTARGHGESIGWQETSESDRSQFSWSRLADDMMGVANYYGYSQIVVGGSSMGSATALYAAIKYPDRVKGLIMAKPPTGWVERENRKKYLLGSAKKLKEIEKDGEVFHNVLIGATTANFPPLEDYDSYRKIQCPVLILGLLGDESHPEVSARNLHERIPQSELYFAKDYDEAELLWPSLIRDFLDKIN